MGEQKVKEIKIKIQFELKTFSINFKDYNQRFDVTFFIQIVRFPIFDLNSTQQIAFINTLNIMLQQSLVSKKVIRENSPKQSSKTNEFNYALKAYELISDNWQILANCYIKEDCIAQFQYKNITKIKVKAERGCNGFYKVKLTLIQKDHFTCFSSTDQVLVLSEVLKRKVYNKLDVKPEDQTFINLCEGEVLKKQFFLFGWQKGYLFISKAGLTYAKTRQGQPDLFISKIGQIWTRFEFIQDNKYIVFKTRHNLLKYEFAVPVQNAVKWGRALCSLLHYQ